MTRFVIINQKKKKKKFMCLKTNVITYYVYSLLYCYLEIWRKLLQVYLERTLI